MEDSIMENDLQTNETPEQKTEATQPEQKTVEQLQAEIDAIKAAETANNATLESVFNDLALKIPEKYHSLIPKGLHLTDRIKWVNDAYSLGLFDAPKQQNSPDHARPMPPKDVDLNAMSPHELMLYSFKQ